MLTGLIDLINSLEPGVAMSVGVFLGGAIATTFLGVGMAVDSRRSKHLEAESLDSAPATPTATEQFYGFLPPWAERP